MSGMGLAWDCRLIVDADGNLLIRILELLFRRIDPDCPGTESLLLVVDLDGARPSEGRGGTDWTVSIVRSALASTSSRRLGSLGASK